MNKPISDGVNFDALFDNSFFMASLFLNQSQREWYKKAPAEISEYDLMQFFQITQQDKIFLKSLRREYNLLGVVLQIGSVRFMGFLPDKWQEQIPENVAVMMNGQLNSNIELMALYGTIYNTRTEHLCMVLKYLKFRRWQPWMKSGFRRGYSIKGWNMATNQYENQAHSNSRIGWYPRYHLTPMALSGSLQ